MKHPASFLFENRGAALVEFTLLMPILFGLVFGLIEFGRATFQHHTAEKGVKAAARFVARAPAPDRCNPSGSAYNSAVASAKTLAQYGALDSSGSPSLSNWTNPSDVNVALTAVSNAPSGGVRPWRGQCDQIHIVTVSTQFPYNDLGLLKLLGITSLTIQASHQEVFIGD
ncbi:MAG: TadE/TadG family type IV pilus assembly protein [Henriciella sp.]